MMEQEAVAIFFSLLFLTINQLCIQKDQKPAEYQAALQYSCSKEICHYTNHILGAVQLLCQRMKNI